MQKFSQLTTLAGSLLLLAICHAPAARAQATRGVSPAPARTESPSTNNPGGYQTMTAHDPAFEQWRSLKGKIERLRPEDNAVVIRDEKTSKLFRFSLDAKTKFKADKGTDLAGRKKLSLADFRAGQAVSLKYRQTDGKPLELRLRTDKS